MNLSIGIKVRTEGGGAAPKSDWAGQEADQSSDAAAHFGQEGGAGAVSLAWLATGPGSSLALDRTTQDAHDRGRDRMAYPAPIFARTDIQRRVRAILDAPVLGRQVQEALWIDLLGRQSGDDPDRLNFLPSPTQFANPVNPGHQGHMRKTDLRRCDRLHRNPPPLDAPVSLFNRQRLMGKDLPEGSERLVLGGSLGCP
jgi:hypothetical protein